MEQETFRALLLVVAGIIGTMVAVIGFLLRHSWVQLLKSNEDVKAALNQSREELHKELSEMKEVLRDMKADLRALDMTDRQQGRDIMEHGIRLRGAENLLARLTDRFDEFGKFLHSKFGFVQRPLDVGSKE